MPRSLPNFRRFLLPLLGLVALWLAGCSDRARTAAATEQDEPDFREGAALMKAGRRQEALSYFLKVIVIRGDDAAESHLNAGLLYVQQINDPLAAIYHFKKYLALRPNSQQAQLVRQRIDAATRDFARTLPAQPLENQLQRVDLVATLDRLKQENDALKQELAGFKAGRGNLETFDPVGAVRSAPTNPTTVPAINFSMDAVPTVRPRPATSPARRPPVPSVPTVSRREEAPAKPAAAVKPAAVRKHVVKPGDTLFKLAQQYYGNRAKWRDIFAANRNVMKNETDLSVGTELKIP